MRGDLFMKCEVIGNRFRDVGPVAKPIVGLSVLAGARKDRRLWGKGVQISEQNQPDF